MSTTHIVFQVARQVCIHFREAKSFLMGAKMLPVRMRKNQVNKKMQQIYKTYVSLLLFSVAAAAVVAGNSH